MSNIALQMIPYGGVYGHTVSALVAELFHINNGPRNEVGFVNTMGDSLLPRRRSIVLSQFANSKYDVIVTLDHDLSWTPGNAERVAEKALELGTIVGGLYSKRQKGRGWGSRLMSGTTDFKIPSDRVIDADYLGSGFMAIPQIVVRKMLEDPAKHGLTKCQNDKVVFWDFYHTITVPHVNISDTSEYLSEDWAFCYRAKLAGFQPKIDLIPKIYHFGDVGFHAGDGAIQPTPGAAAK